MRALPAPAALLLRLGQLALLGLAVGLACWPLNLLDRWQELLLALLPASTGRSWNGLALALALAPVLVMPLLLWLQAGPWSGGAGSGIPQTLVCLEKNEHSDSLLAARPTLQRLGLWSIATLALLPLGREGPVVQLGAAVAAGLRRRFPGLLAGLGNRELLAAAGGAGLAAGFNTPLVGVVFMAEELTARFDAALIWPALVICEVAALVSNLGGQPEFALGLLRASPGEPLQALLAVPVAIAAGLLGAIFGRMLLDATRRFTPLARRRPLRTGLLLGALLALFALVSGGRSGGDGEALMAWLIQDPGAHQAGALVLMTRLLGPCIVLGASVPGGLIDPALSLGAALGPMVLGPMVLGPVGLGPVGLAVGMAAALAGATQLPVLSVVFTLRLAGDQQLLPGVLLAAVLGAYVSRLLMPKPIYHALSEGQQESGYAGTVSP